MQSAEARTYALHDGRLVMLRCRCGGSSRPRGRLQQNTARGRRLVWRTTETTCQQQMRNYMYVKYAIAEFCIKHAIHGSAALQEDSVKSCTITTELTGHLCSLHVPRSISELARKPNGLHTGAWWRRTQCRTRVSVVIVHIPRCYPFVSCHNIKQP